MAHAITILKCKNGHSLPINFDSNECGCHHEGKPCIIITCSKCLEDSIKNDFKDKLEQLQIPLDKETMKELKDFIQNG